MFHFNRAKNYVAVFKRDEDLPLEVWRYLVKRRSNFKCEQCNSNSEVEAHHVKRRGDNGRNILSNGMSLCLKCHGKTRRVKVKNSLRSRFLAKLLGKRLFSKVMKCHTEDDLRSTLSKVGEEKNELNR